MKSVTNMVETIVLEGMTKVLENAAKDADINIVMSVHPMFIYEMD